MPAVVAAAVARRGTAAAVAAGTGSPATSSSGRCLIVSHVSKKMRPDVFHARIEDNRRAWYQKIIFFYYDAILALHTYVLN